MYKLVRDGYKNIIEEDKLSIANQTVEQFYLLNEKIKEELGELRETVYNDVNEYGDLIEALYAMAKFQGIQPADIETARLKKRKELGGFDNFLKLNLS